MFLLSLPARQRWAQIYKVSFKWLEFYLCKWGVAMDSSYFKLLSLMSCTLLFVITWWSCAEMGFLIKEVGVLQFPDAESRLCKCETWFKTKYLPYNPEGSNQKYCKFIQVKLKEWHWQTSVFTTVLKKLLWHILIEFLEWSDFYYWKHPFSQEATLYDAACSLFFLLVYITYCKCYCSLYGSITWIRIQEIPQHITC